MKTLRTLFICLFVVFGAAAVAPCTARADDNDTVSFDYFYNALAPYGQWLDIPGYGYCWQPNGVDANWQPYTDGYWVYTDAGWTWMSYEDFGWITYHYGRWADVEDTGWVWVPDYQWAPSWVSWRSGGDYVGWAPLPPEARFDAGIGISFWVDSNYDIGPGFYRFCRTRDFGAPVLSDVIIDPNQNVVIINNTTNITNITTNNNIVYSGGPSYRSLSKHSERPIQRLRLVQQTDPSSFQGGHEGKGAFAQARGNELFVPAPRIAPPTQPFKPEKVARTLEKPKIDKGWSHVTDPQQKQQIQSKIAAQTKGVKPEQAHAKPVTAQALSVIPNKNAPVVPGNVAGPQPAPSQPGHRGQNLQPFTAGPSATPTHRQPNMPTPPQGNVAGPQPTLPPTGHRGQNLQPFTAGPSATPSRGQPKMPTPPQGNVAGPQPKPPTPPQGPNQQQIQQQEQQKAAAAAAAAHQQQTQQQEQQKAAAAAAAHQQQIQQQEQQKAAAAAAAHQQQIQQQEQQRAAAAAAAAAARGGKPTPTPTPGH